MALLPEKLISRLNKDYALGEYQFGTVLQQCLASIANNPPSGACITLPVYPDQATAEANCGAITGNIYWDSGSNCVTYYNGVEWVCADYETLESNVTGNTAKINLNCANILNLTNQLTILSDSFNAHDHNGINSPTIDIKALTTTAPAGSYFFSNGSGIDCAPIVQGTKVELNGTVVSADAVCMDFVGSCFAVTQTAPGEVQVDIPKLPGILAATITNATCCANNTVSITNLSNTVVTINTQVIQNTTDINTLTNDFNTHTHDGTDSIQIQQGNVLSIVGGAAMPNNSIVCADGAGGWQVFTKDFLNIPVGARNVGTLGVGVFDQINATDSFLEFRNVAAGDGITVTLDANDNIVVSLDKTGVPTAPSVDPANDTVMIFDNDVGACAKTSLQSILDTLTSTSVVAGTGVTVTQAGEVFTVNNAHTFSGGTGVTVTQTGDNFDIVNDHTFTAGKGLDVVKTGEDHEYSLDLDGFTAVAGTTIDRDLDFFPVVKADGSCVKVPVDELAEEIEEADATTIGVVGPLADPTALVSSGTWTPTNIGTNANVTTAADGIGYWHRIGDVVHYSMRVAVQSTANSTNTTAPYSLPIPSNFTGTQDVVGNGGFINTGANATAWMYADADTVADAIRLRFRGTNTTTNTTYVFTGSYIIK